MAINTHILLVDDDGSLLATLRTCLEMADYHCMEAKDGYDAPDWLEKDHPIDLIVIDHQMPSVSGLELINGLKSQVSTKTIPVIFYSGQLTEGLIALRDIKESMLVRLRHGCSSLAAQHRIIGSFCQGFLEIP